MQLQRQAIDRDSSLDGVSHDLLAAQRRKIYERIAEPAAWWSRIQLRRWASAAAAVMVLAGGVLLVENNRKPAAPNTISDAQLAQDVSRMAEDPEPPATAPLQALFEE
jgi:anti-sigma-K factor RskA